MPRTRVLLTGAGGRIGPHILPTFHERYDLTVLDRNPVAGEPATILSDLQDIDVLRRAMQGCEAVVHLAATANEAPFLDDLVPNNIVGMYNMLTAAVETGVRRFVFASTVQTVRSHAMTLPVRPADPPRPVSLYGATKVFGETLGRYFHDTHGLEFVAIRIGWFQPYDSPMFRERPVVGTIWLSPRDAARILQCAVEKPDVGYAVVFGTSKTTKDVLSLQEARDLLGYEPQDDAADYLAAAAGG
jgi:nucleoside-diphosphate-sugar epimerase